MVAAVVVVVVVVVSVVVVVLGVTQADPDDGRRWAGGAWPGRAQQLIQSVQVVQTSDISTNQHNTTASIASLISPLTQ